ncbi:MAG: hypothetical protein K8R35_10745 [Bacteroidales bacterium]|nr:hypothetical protein [Bacteroidales bacterium]
MKIKKPLISVTALIPVLATILMISTIPSYGIGDYTNPAAVNINIKQLQQSHSNLVKIHKLAVSPGGSDVLMMEIGPEINRTTKSKPAILVVGNMSGISPVTTEAALSLARRLTGDPDLCSEYTWYIVPLGNPDAYSRYFSGLLFSDPRNFTPFNDDMDDQTDEDGFNDLNGDGYITSMRVKKPDGEWIVVNGNDRLMRKADITKGEKGVYKLYTEGLDDDGDGKYNEDGKGGTDVNINFPHLFKFFAPTSGMFGGSTPETYNLMKFAFEHPELSMVFAFGETNFLLTPPKGGRKGSVDMDKISIPEEISKGLGFDHTRTYTMKEIMEKVQPMLPPGMQIDEGMIASFLGLGAIVNPMKADLGFYNKISGEYKDYLKEKGVEEKRFDPKPAKDASFELWSYYHLGLPVFSMDIWGVPKVKEEKKESSGVTVESLADMTSDEFLALGEDKINLFLKEIGAPAQYSATMITGAVSGGQLTPKQISGMLKQMPKPEKDDQKGDPKELAMLAFSANYRDDAGFVEWKQYTHPTLGDVEIGGFIPFVDNTPPVEIVDSLLDLHVPYIFELVKQLPHLRINDLKVTEKGGGVYQIDAWIENENYLPFTTAMGKRNKIPVPAIITVEGSGITLLSGKKRTSLTELGGMKSVKKTWLIQSGKTATLTIRLETKRAGSDSKQIKIGG